MPIEGLTYISDLGVGGRHIVCHPYSRDNLHAMAHDLGIKRCWFHRDHYDAPKTRVVELLAFFRENRQRTVVVESAEQTLGFCSLRTTRELVNYLQQVGIRAPYVSRPDPLSHTGTRDRRASQMIETVGDNSGTYLAPDSGSYVTTSSVVTMGSTDGNTVTFNAPASVNWISTNYTLEDARRAMQRHVAEFTARDSEFTPPTPEESDEESVRDARQYEADRLNLGDPRSIVPHVDEPPLPRDPQSQSVNPSSQE